MRLNLDGRSSQADTNVANNNNNCKQNIISNWSKIMKQLEADDDFNDITVTLPSQQEYVDYVITDGHCPADSDYDLIGNNSTYLNLSEHEIQMEYCELYLDDKTSFAPDNSLDFDTTKRSGGIKRGHAVRDVYSRHETDSCHKRRKCNFLQRAVIN